MLVSPLSEHRFYRLLKVGLISLLTIYSVALLYAELKFSQDYVRNYFTDITGPVRFYAVNTTLTTFLLWAIALIFYISMICVDEVDSKKKTLIFYTSQIFLFLYLGLDERFGIHEGLGVITGIEDGFIVLGFGLLEIGLLGCLGDLGKRPRRVKLYLYVAAALFAIMVLIDVFLPPRTILRLSIEDLSKTWAGVFLFMFALEICYGHIFHLKESAQVRVDDG